MYWSFVYNIVPTYFLTISGEILKYGNIIIQTLVGDLLIKNVEHPSEIYEALQDAVNDVSTDREVGHEEIEEEEIDD